MTTSLDEVVERTRGQRGLGAVAGATLEVTLGRLARALARQAEDEQAMQMAIQPIPFPPVLFPVAATALTTPTSATLLGPEDGQVWDIRRVTLAGWTTADAAINVNLYRELNSPNVGNPENRLRKFNDSAPGNETWSPGGGLILKSPDGLLITGSGFTTTTGIYLVLEGIQVDQRWLPRYLL